jgi:outer membrane receptor for monomeric catechols
VSFNCTVSIHFSSMSRSIRIPRCVAGVALCAGFIAGSATAQTEHAAVDSASSDADLGPIFVTARKRTERLQDVPDAISAFTADAIQSADIQDVKDVAVRVPNVSIVEAQQPGVALINIRGVGQARNGEPPVAMIVDGVELSNSYQITQELFDVERIEVLKGPQGAVYGRNAVGGAINIVTKQPTNDFTGFVETGAADAGMSFKTTWLDLRPSAWENVMQAMVLKKLNVPLEWTHLADRSPGQGEIRVNILACGVCRTDLHVVDGKLCDPQVPIIPGQGVAYFSWSAGRPARSSGWKVPDSEGVAIHAVLESCIVRREAGIGNFKYVIRAATD